MKAQKNLRRSLAQAAQDIDENRAEVTLALNELQIFPVQGTKHFDALKSD
jgi:hypothetical protein